MEFSPHNSMKKAGVHSQLQNPGSGLQYKVLNDCVTNASQNIANVGLSVKSPSMDASHKSCYSESKKHTRVSLFSSDSYESMTEQSGKGKPTAKSQLFDFTDEDDIFPLQPGDIFADSPSLVSSPHPPKILNKTDDSGGSSTVRIKNSFVF